MSLPVYLDRSPQDGFIGIQLNSPVFFRIEDGDGLNLSTLWVKINGNYAILNGLYQPGFSGTITNENPQITAVSIVIVPATNFSYNQLVNVSSEIQDNLSNLGRDFYSFLTIPNPDKTAPLVAVSPHGGLYNSSQTITLTANEPSTVIRYTLNGNDPNLLSTVYTAPFFISTQGLTTLKFFGVDSANNYDKIRTEQYTIDTVIPTVTATPAGGNIFYSISVELKSSKPNCTIYYTTNNSVPTTSSTIYSVPIIIQDNKQTTLKFFCVDAAGNNSILQTEVYNIEIAKNNIIVKNVFVRFPYIRNQLQILWEDMYPMYNQIIGYNVYRSDVEHGTYQKLNSDLITVNQYVDATLDLQIIQEDVSSQFKRTVNISRSVDDNFPTPCFDQTKWKESDVAELMFPYNGLIFSDKTGLSIESKLTSKFKMQNDFDIQIDFELLKWMAPLSKISSCMFRVKKDDNNYIQVAKERGQFVDVYSSTKVVNSNPDLPITVSSSNEYGTFKIKRVNDLVTTYFYDKNSNSFVSVQTFTYLGDLYVEIAGRSAEVPIELRWTNFKVNIGSPVIIEPLNQLREYVIQVMNPPIVNSSGTNTPTDDIKEVDVSVNGQRAYVRLLQGLEGHIYLETEKAYDEVKRQYFKPPVPDENSTVLVTYKTKYHSTNIDLKRNFFYKVTAVTLEDETDLDILKPEFLAHDAMNYIFQEAIRRNAWLLEQGGEQVLLYIKKRAGTPCPCTKRDVKERTHRKPDQDCNICFGSGFVGGFFGPMPVRISNLMNEQRISQTERGLRLVSQLETWMGPYPLVTQRDMIIRRNGERFSLGPITPVLGPNGVIVQQHFSIDFIDAKDVRYTFAVQPLPSQFERPFEDKDGTKVPEISVPKEREELVTNLNKVSHENKNVDRVVRGRSIVFESTEY